MRRIVAVLLLMLIAPTVSAQTSTPTPPYCATSAPGGTPTATALPGSYYERVLALQPDHLLAYWRLSDTSGTSAIDATTNARNGTYAGATLNGNTFVNGDAAPQFDAINDSVGLSSAIGSVFNGSEGAISLWIRTNGVGPWADGTEDFIFRALSNTGQQLALRKQSTANTLNWNRVGRNINYTLPSGASANWMHIVFSWSAAGNYTRAFLDGALVGSDTAPAWTGSSYTILQISGEDATHSIWNGSISNAAVWDVPLSADEVATISYAAASSPTPTPLTPTPVCVVYQPTATATFDVSSFFTMPPAEAGTPGQPTRFDYTVSAGERHTADLLTWLLYSAWGMFLFGVVVILARYRSR